MTGDELQAETNAASDEELVVSWLRFVRIMAAAGVEIPQGESILRDAHKAGFAAGVLYACNTTTELIRRRTQR